MGGFIFNSGGFRGIHWWRELDKYSVFIYTGGGTEWLPGDGAAGWSGDIWFSDRTLALKARDKYRQGRYRNFHTEQQMEMVGHAGCWPENGLTSLTGQSPQIFHAASGSEKY
jgi:hypothetical protein